MSQNSDQPRPEDHIEPLEFVRAIMRISPEDAEKAREKSPATRKRRGRGQGGPTADYGDE